jgi:membrane-associated phospholipid phosphatase
MAFSRLYVGVHYPSDVAAGILIGVLGGLAGAWLYMRDEKYWLEKKKGPDIR